MVAKKRAPAKKKVVVKRKVVVKKKAAEKKKSLPQKNKNGLTDQQQRFVDEYMIDLNATKAYIRAGYTARGKVAEVNASRLLGNAKVATAVKEAKKKRSEETAVDAKYVLLRHVAIDQMDVLDILSDDGTLKPLSEWPKVWRTSLTGFEVSEIVNGGDPIGALKKIKWMDKTQNLKALGSHVDVQAYKEKLELSGTEEFEKLIEKRMRAIESGC